MEKCQKKVGKVRNVRSQFTVKQSEKRLAIAARWGGRWAFIRLFGAARVRGNISIGHLKAEGVVYFRVAHPEHLLSSPHRDGRTRIKKVHVFTSNALLANELNASREKRPRRASVWRSVRRKKKMTAGIMVSSLFRRISHHEPIETHIFVNDVRFQLLVSYHA